MWLAEKVGNMYRHPYDLGVYENLVSVRIGSFSLLSITKMLPHLFVIFKHHDKTCLWIKIYQGMTINDPIKLCFVA